MLLWFFLQNTLPSLSEGLPRQWRFGFTSSTHRVQGSQAYKVKPSQRSVTLSKCQLLELKVRLLHTLLPLSKTEVCSYTGLGL